MGAVSVAVVTGASRGLGAGLTRAFADAGWAVATCARHEPEVGEVRVALDVTDATAVDAFCDRAAAELGPIDLWVGNAGILGPITPGRDLDPAALAEVLAVNVIGVLNGARAYIRHRRAVGGGGCLVTISSGAGKRPYAGWSAYCASKAAVDRLTEVLALEEASTGLRVHAVAPGVIDTDMQATIRASSAEVFPEIDRFRQMKDDDDYNSPAAVARFLAELALGPARSEVVLRAPDG